MVALPPGGEPPPLALPEPLLSVELVEPSEPLEPSELPSPPDASACIEAMLKSLDDGHHAATARALQVFLKQVPADPDRASAAVLALFRAIAGAHDRIVARPPQAGGAGAAGPATDERRFVNVFTAALCAPQTRWLWFEDPQEIQWHVVESLPCPAESDADFPQSLRATRAMLGTWLNVVHGGTLDTRETAKLVSAIFATVNASVPAPWLDAALAGLLDAYTGPPKAESKSRVLAFLAGGDRPASGSAYLTACDALIDCLGHLLHALTPAQIEAASQCLARRMALTAEPRLVVQGVALRLLDCLLGYTDSRSRQWAAVLTGCRAGLLAAGADRLHPTSTDPKARAKAQAKTESKSRSAEATAQASPHTVMALLDALVTWAAKHHAKRVHGREATLRQCVRTGVLPEPGERQRAPGPSAVFAIAPSSSSSSSSRT